MKTTFNTIMVGKVRPYKRSNCPYWQCSTFVFGKKRRTSTKQEVLAQAKDFAEDWYLTLRYKARHGKLNNSASSAKAAKKFKDEYEAITFGRRSPKWVHGDNDRIRCRSSEVICSDITEHRIRVENRRADIKNQSMPTLADVQNRDYDEWTTDRIVIDTAGKSIDDAYCELLERLKPLA